MTIILSVHLPEHLLLERTRAAHWLRPPRGSRAQRDHWYEPGAERTACGRWARQHGTSWATAHPTGPGRGRCGQCERSAFLSQLRSHLPKPVPYKRTPRVPLTWLDRYRLRITRQLALTLVSYRKAIVDIELADSWGKMLAAIPRWLQVRPMLLERYVYTPAKRAHWHAVAA